MPIFLIIFLTLGVITFGTVAIAMRPSVEQKVVQKRITTMAAAKGEIERIEASQLLKNVKGGSFEWLSGLVKGSAFSTMLQRLLLQSNSSSTEGGILITVLGLGIAAGVFTFALTGAILFGFCAGMAGAFIPILMLKMKRSRRVKAFEKTLPDSVDMISRSLRAGHSLQAALSIVAEQAVEPAKREFSEVFKQQNYGMPLRDALLQLLDRVPSQDLRVLVTGILVQKDTGGNLAEMLDKIVEVIRERIKIKGEVATHTAQGRMTGWILCALPIAMLIAINIINPGYSSMLFATSIGHIALYIGAGLLTAGGLIIRAIVNGIEV